MENRAEARDLDVVGVGGMVVDRMHRAVALVGEDGKEFLRPLGNGAFVALHPGGVTLNHLGWAAALGLDSSGWVRVLSPPLARSQLPLQPSKPDRNTHFLGPGQ